ncbi:hypothetical protein D8674_003066 [Pyrus ussuriensis x Pyrus communis]|uniref:Uncharacterized protein n=1 Tax=Pyrus ussuriensis x Pyrus communis TaxID=2448454 RepID=A0A5N5FK33_9ROSA|nr:hypothetical protein D8674_003066 [Pyrus ussuriensis x Pyrus communis]
MVYTKKRWLVQVWLRWLKMYKLLENEMYKFLEKVYKLVKKMKTVIPFLMYLSILKETMKKVMKKMLKKTVTL